MQLLWFYALHIAASLVCLPISLFIFAVLLLVSSFRNTTQSFEYMERCLMPHPKITYNFTDIYNETHEANAIHVHNPKQKNTLVLIHGTGGSSHTWHLVTDDLSQHYEHVYLLNLPGFGFTEGSKRLLTAEAPEINTYYTQFIHQSFQELDITKATILAHSYGGLQAIPYTLAHQDTVEKLILMSVPGIHPVFTQYAYYWGILFWSNFPQRYVRYLGTLAIKAVHTLYSFFNVGMLYYYELKLWERCWADELIKKHFTINWTQTWFHAFTLKELLSLSIPIAFIHGENDALAPPHSAEIIKHVTNHETPVYTIQGTGHNPAISPEHKSKFMEAFLEATQNAKPFPSHINSEKINKTDLNNWFRCTFDISKNKTILNNYYSYLRDLFNKK